MQLARPARGAHPVRSAAIALGSAALTAVITGTEIGRPILWRDELATWSAASRTVPQIFHLLRHTDAVIGPYYLVLHMWMGVFGDSTIAMRAPSALAMAGAAAAVALIARRLAGGLAGAAAGVTFAVIPAVSRYGQEARPYAFAALFSALATLALLRVLDRPGRWAWLRYALAMAAAGASSLVTLSLFAGHALAALISRSVSASGREQVAASVAAPAKVASFSGGHGGPGEWAGPRGGEGAPGEPAGRRGGEGAPGEPAGRQGSRGGLAWRAWSGRVWRAWSWRVWSRWARGFAACAVLAVVIDAPLIIVGHSQAAHQLDGLAFPGLSSLVTLWPQLFSSGPAAAVVLLLAAVALVVKSPYRRAAAFSVVTALVPVLVIWAASQGSVSYWTTRYLIFTLPAWAVAAGCGVAVLAALARVPAVRYGAAAVVLVAVASAGATAQAAIREPQAHNWWTYPAPSGDIPIGYNLAADIIAAHDRPGDGIAYEVGDDDRWEVDAGVSYYLGNRRAPRLVFQVLSAPQAGLLHPVLCAHPSKCLYGVRRVWVVYIPHLVRGGRGGTPFQALYPSETAALHAYRFRVRHSYSADGITVDLLTISTKSIG